MKVVSFCFDDGFRATADKVRAIFGRADAVPCFCVLARPDLAEDPYIRGADVADWSYWREAQAAGCEIGMHGYAHEPLDKRPLAETTELLRRCFDAFSGNLTDYDPAKQVFHAAYLRAPPAVLAWLKDRVAAVRLRLDGDGISHPDRVVDTGLIDCVCYGHDGADALLLGRIHRFVNSENGVLTVVLHGVDNEGWGPIRSGTLERCLEMLVQSEVTIAPPAKLLRQKTSPPQR